MIHIAIAASFRSLAMFDAGRRPLAFIHSNTPKSKTKRSVKGKKADNSILPQATTNDVDTFDLSDDDDIPLALLIQLRTASLCSGQPTINCGTAIRSKAVEVDINSDSPFTQLIMKSSPPPAPELVTLRQPLVEAKKPALQTIPVQPKKAAILSPVGRVKPMMCIVPDCPYEWHIHINSSNP